MGELLIASENQHFFILQPWLQITIFGV